MALSARDHEDLTRPPEKLLRGARMVSAMLQPLFRIPWIRRRVADTVGGISGKIFRHWERHEYQAAYEAAVYALDKYRSKEEGLFGGMNHHHWWGFMHYAVDSVLQLPAGAERSQLLQRARTGIEPFEGYDVAYSFIWFARWAYEQKEYEKAENLARVASEADETWGYPDFFRGWMALALGHPGAQEHLMRAAQRDPRLIFQISNDGLCKSRPDIIAELKRQHAKCGAP